LIKNCPTERSRTNDLPQYTATLLEEFEMKPAKAVGSSRAPVDKKEILNMLNKIEK